MYLSQLVVVGAGDAYFAEAVEVDRLLSLFAVAGDRQCVVDSLLPCLEVLLLGVGRGHDRLDPRLCYSFVHSPILRWRLPRRCRLPVLEGELAGCRVLVSCPVRASR